MQPPVSNLDRVITVSSVASSGSATLEMKTLLIILLVTYISVISAVTWRAAGD